MNKDIKVSLIQEAPVFFDIEGTTRKICELIGQEAQEGADLIVFPESFLPGYPRGFDFDVLVGSRTDKGREVYRHYYENSLAIGDPYFNRIVETVRQSGVYLVLGVTEKMAANSSLYCSMMYFSPRCGFLGAHRKIKPTGAERLIWAEADGQDLIACQTGIGTLGGLICWENYMPAARMAMYEMGVEIYLAPTADARETWVSTLRHIALEGRCYVLGCNQYMAFEDYPGAWKECIKNRERSECQGGTVAIGPDGGIIGGPIYGATGILKVTLEANRIVENKLDFDVVGHYQRPDIFQYQVVNGPNLIRETSRNIS